MSGHLPVTMMGEPDLIMARQILTFLVAAAFACGAFGLAQAQTAASKDAKSAAKPAAAPAKPATAAKPEAAASGGTDPTPIGQFRTWCAFTAMPNGNEGCLSPAQPA